MKSTNIDRFVTSRDVKRARRMFVNVNTGLQKRTTRRAARRAVNLAVRQGDYDTLTGRRLTGRDIS